MIAVLTTDAALHAIEPEWRALWRRAGSPPFQSPDWLLPWWAAFGTGLPRIAIRRTNGALTGLLPMYLLHEGPDRKLLPLGVGLTDYTDALLDPTCPNAAPLLAAPLLAAALLEAALAASPDATSCALPDLPPAAALRAAAAPAGWREVPLPATPCPVLRLAAGRAAIPPGMWRNIRLARNRADRHGPWRAGLADDPAAVWADLAGLHAARWAAEGGGVLASPAVQAFHAAAVPRLAAAGTLRMYAVRFAGKVVAAYHTLAAPDGLYFYLSGYDPAEAYASPGTLLLGHILDQAWQDGRPALHFLRGAEPYKYAWGAQDEWNAGRLLHPI